MVRDLPPVSGKIIWARQISRQLRLYLKRVQDVLGKGWDQHVDGRRLNQLGKSFLKKLDPKAMYATCTVDDLHSRGTHIPCPRCDVGHAGSLRGWNPSIARSSSRCRACCSM